MELDARFYARYQFDETALETWRKHACLMKVSLSQREALYNAAKPFFEEVARNLLHYHSWRQVDHDSNVLFCIQPPDSDIPFSLPVTYQALFEHARPCERMFESTFHVHQGRDDGQLCVAEPLTDTFHLLQLLAPGALSLVKAEYAAHEMDDDGDVAWITWLTSARGLPPPAWMELHTHSSPQLVAIFGSLRWAALQRAAIQTPVFTSADITFG